jgi:DNA-binding GntR family transcriptional regulator
LATSYQLQRPRSLAEQAAEQIRLRIIRGDFQLGEALSETALAAELGVSKTPIREAFLRLKTEGLVDIQPQRGTFVFQMTASEVRELSDLRDVLETAALASAMRSDARGLGQALGTIVVDMRAALAARRADRYRELDQLFHQRIIDHCGNTFLANCYETIAFRVQSLRNRLSQDGDLNARSLEEHRDLARLVAKGEAAKAKAYLSKHIGTTASDYERILRQAEAAR